MSSRLHFSRHVSALMSLSRKGMLIRELRSPGGIITETIHEKDIPKELLASKFYRFRSRV